MLIIEPNTQLTLPYHYVSDLSSEKHTVLRVSTLEQAIIKLDSHQPKVVFLSTSFDPNQALEFLEKLKEYSSTGIIPLIFVVDWSQRVQTLLGTSWGDAVGILHSLSSQEEVAATLKRLRI